MAYSELPDSDLELSLKGPDAERLTAELAEFMADEFGTRPSSQSAAKRRDVAVMKGDPIAITALVLSVPGAMLAAVDLAQRLKLKKKVDRLLDWVRRKAPEESGNRIELYGPDGRSIDLDRAGADEVLELSRRDS